MNAVRFRQTPSKKALFRFGVTAAACIAAMIAGPFIVSYDNPLTATRVIAAITIFLVAITSPKASLYLLILEDRSSASANPRSTIWALDTSFRNCNPGTFRCFIHQRPF
jgi:hypothetical protein